MTPRLHPYGKSFKGAAAYLLHDKDKAQTNERVEWIEMRNLATENPDMAWRIMAATAMDAKRLKQEAGVKGTGQKSVNSVLHLSLSWNPDDEGVTREEQLRAANAAIRFLRAEDRQAMIIAHNDTDHPHVHILMNRVSPEDGRMLKDSYSYTKLSKWALGYVKERGRHDCPERFLNWAARERGEYVRGTPTKVYHLHIPQQAVNDDPGKAKVEAQQRAKDAAIAKQAAEMRRRHAQQFQKLTDQHKQRMAETRRQGKRNMALAKEAVRKNYRRSWEELFHEDRAERAQFSLREEKLFGRVQNAFRAIDFGSIIRGEDRRGAIGEAFQAFSNSGARLEGLKKAQERRAMQLLTQQRASEREAAHKAAKKRDQQLSGHRTRFEKDRSDLILKQGLESAKLRADWLTRNEQRGQAWRKAQSPAPVAGGHAPDREPDSEAMQRLKVLRERIQQSRERPDRERDDDFGDRDR